MNPILFTLLLAASTLPAWAQAPAESWQAGAVVDLAGTSREPALGGRQHGLALGHSDVTVFGPLGPHFQATATLAAHGHERKTETGLEEAWLQTRSLPAGLQARVGRFASQIGYLNEQHPHADDFVQRPLLYRAFLGGHWFDDGLRLNWTAPTDHYLRLGVEAFRGRQLAPEATSRRRAGALAFSARTGGDLGLEHSWQAGLSFLHNRRAGATHGVEEDAHDDHHGHEEAGHDHAHGAAYAGRRLWLADLAWKWAPQGNNRNQQLRAAVELARVSGLGPHAGAADTHLANYLSLVWRFAPDWEVGTRVDALRVREAHGDHFHGARLREGALMLAYKPTHAQTLRLQFTRQRAPAGFEDAARHSFQLQYILNFGAHAAHTF